MRGFTLVEILVSLLILSVVLAGIFAVLNVGQMNWNSSMSSLDLQQQVRQAMDGMSKEIRQSSFSNITINPDQGAINFTVPIDITTNPITYSSTINYYLNDNSQIVREHPSGTTKILANDISNLSFCCVGIVAANCLDYDNSTAVQIYVEGNKTVRGRTYLPFNLTEQVRLRNE